MALLRPCNEKFYWPCSKGSLRAIFNMLKFCRLHVLCIKTGPVSKRTKSRRVLQISTHIHSRSMIFTFSSYKKILVLCGKSLSEFSSNMYVLRLHESEKTIFTKSSVCPPSMDTIALDRTIGLE